MRGEERRTRTALLEKATQLHRGGFIWRQVSASIEIPERTLRSWRRPGSFQARRRGRPCLEVDPQRRSRVFQFLEDVTGPMVGLPTLRAAFPGLPRVALEELLRRYRRWWRKKHRMDGGRLTWLVPGSVWAMDFTETPCKIEGRYSYLFTVRDLASHYHLCWEPVATERAEEVIPILGRLFLEYGRPLVMKSDNGSAFIAEQTRDFFRDAEVAVLYSPPRKPKYNGALERSNTTMKAWTSASAESDGRSLSWKERDLRRALETANIHNRPWGADGQTPGESWAARQIVSQAQRRLLLDALVQERVVARDKLGLAQLTDDELSAADLRTIDRIALSPILQRLDYLRLTPVRRAPPKPKRPRFENGRPVVEGERATPPRGNETSPDKEKRWHRNKRVIYNTAAQRDASNLRLDGARTEVSASCRDTST